MRGKEPSGSYRRRRHTVRYRYHQKSNKRPLMIAAAALTAVLLYAVIRLALYHADLAKSRHTAQTLSQLYYADPAAASSPMPSAVPQQTPASTEAPGMAMMPITEPPPAAEVTIQPDAALAAVPYPQNAELKKSARFKALQKQNRDIVAWLTIDRLIDEAVVQRDNIYYMDHNALGEKNINGALFLDGSCSLKTRPYSLVIYGHNMKSGAMFGSLRNFENISFYHKSPFITLDTQYETGRYVIFSVAQISLLEGTNHYIDPFDLHSLQVSRRRQMIDVLTRCSVHTCTVDVTPEDQLLLLITCVDSDDERRVVAARRIRDGESEQTLAKQVEKARKK